MPRLRRIRSVDVPHDRSPARPEPIVLFARPRRRDWLVSGREVRRSGGASAHAFNAARAEILKREELRDRMLVTFVTLSVGILGGTMLVRDPMIGLLVPVFALSAAMVVCQHTRVITHCCCWTRTQTPFPHFARSPELREMHQSSIVIRGVAQAAIFAAPNLVALAYGYRAAFTRVSVLQSGLWWLGTLLTAIALGLQFWTAHCVLEKNRRTGYEHAYAGRRAAPGRRVLALAERRKRAQRTRIRLAHEILVATQAQDPRPFRWGDRARRVLRRREAAAIARRRSKPRVPPR